MEGHTLTWNEFQRRFKGRWGQKEMSSKFAEYKSSLVLPSTDVPPQSPASKAEKTPTKPGPAKRAQHAADMPPASPCTKPHLMTWNQFQVRWMSFVCVYWWFIGVRR